MYGCFRTREGMLINVYGKKRQPTKGMPFSVLEVSILTVGGVPRDRVKPSLLAAVEEEMNEALDSGQLHLYPTGGWGEQEAF